MQQKPEPMDIDRSLQTKPQHNMPFKRPAENSIQTPMNKIQRNFHLDTEYWPNDYPYEEGAVGESMREPEYAEEYFEQLPEEIMAGEAQENHSGDIQLAINFLD